MEFLVSVFSDASPNLRPITNWYGWVGLVLQIALVSGLLCHWCAREKTKSNPQWFLLIGLIILQILAAGFLGAKISISPLIPEPQMIELPKSPVWMIFSAAPWILAAGLFGPWSAALVAAIGGGIAGFWLTNNPFTILETVLIAILFGSALQQRYRKRLFTALRRPIVVVLLVSPFLILYMLFNVVLILQSDVPTALDYVLSTYQGRALGIFLSLLMGALIAEGVAYGLPKLWGGKGALKPAPAEVSLESRIFYTVVPIVLGMVMLLTFVGYRNALTSARKLIVDQMGGAARMVANNVPHVLEIGQMTLQQIASDPRLLTSDKDTLQSLLQEKLRSSVYFQDLYVASLVDDNLSIIASTSPEITSTAVTVEEIVSVKRAVGGVPFQYYTIRPVVGERSVRLMMAARLDEGDDGETRVLIGLSYLDRNPYMLPLIETLYTLEDLQGTGILLNQNNQVIYHSGGGSLLTEMDLLQQSGVAYDSTNEAGLRQLAYYLPAVGHPWGVLFSMSARQEQRLALNIATPLLGLLLLLSAIVLIVQVGVTRWITRSLRELAVEANRIARDKEGLAEPLKVEGEDEVGQMRRAFERMRLSLKTRLDEQDQFLIVSRAVAASLDMETAIQPVLGAALKTGAAAARVALTNDAIPVLDEQTPTRFGTGRGAASLAKLDGQLLLLVRDTPRIVLTNPVRVRLLSFDGIPRPSQALIAFSLRHENLFYGVMWLSYDEPHVFSDDEIRYLTTLASQAALAAANSSLFLHAEIGRRRMEAILEATPDPVLVTDQQGRLLLANPAAWQLFSRDGQLVIRPVVGLPIEEIFQSVPGLLEMLRPENEVLSQELVLKTRTFHTTVTPVLSEKHLVGRVCVLRDITHFKQLDTMKTEFVNTVSHDLRSPLTLLQGYVTMLKMMGKLNDEQTSYLTKISSGAKGMEHLVNNLLSLGRIETGTGLELEMVPIVEVVEQVINNMQVNAEQKHITLIHANTGDHYPIIEADTDFLQQAISNLVENAIKYTPHEGRVTVTLLVNQVEQTVTFSVADNGIGIALVDQPRLFDKFFRVAHREARKQKGSGLGLSIVKSIVESHHGKVWVEGQLGQGSTFHMMLPFRQPEIVK